MRRTLDFQKVSLFTRFVALASLALLSACAGTGAAPSQQASPAAFVYVANRVITFGPNGAVFTGAGEISELQMASDGRLSRVSGSPISLGSDTFAVLAADPLGRFLFAATETSLITYSIAPSSGALTQVATISLPAAAANSFSLGPVVVDHGGKFLYSATPAGLSVYSIASTGVLALVQTVPVPTSAPDTCLQTTEIAFDNAGKFLYVADCGAGPIEGATTSFSVDPTTGTLSMISSILTGTQSGGLAVNPAGNVVYVQNSPLCFCGLSDVILSSNKGQLTVFGTAHISTPAEGSGVFVLMHPSGKFLYETTDESIVGVAVNADGTLGDTISPPTGFPLPFVVGPEIEIGLSPSGDFLLVAQAVNSIGQAGGPSLGAVVSVFAVDPATGNLTPIPRSPFSLDVPSGRPGPPVFVTVSR